MTCVELVRNGGFEENSDWVFPNTPNQAHYAWGIVHNGERSVELGIKLAIAKQTGRYTGGGVLDNGGTTQDDVRSIAYQSLPVPGEVDTATLTFWHWLGTEDEEGDWQRLALISSNNFQVIAEPLVRLDHTGDWRQESFDVTPFLGQNILLYLDVYNDGDGKTTIMYVDDVRLTACRVISGQ